MPVVLETSRFVYDGANVVRDLDGNGATIADYLNGAGIDNKFRQTSGGAVSYFAVDHLGTTLALTDASGNVASSMSYDSFGNVVSGSTPTRYIYSGREMDGDTGLMYYRARWYDSQQGRFVSEDPIGIRGGMNFYAYVGDDPVNHIDPWGLELEQLSHIWWPVPAQPRTPSPLYPDNFDWWGTFWKTYWGLRNEGCFANGGFTADGKTCLPLPIMGCGVTFVTSPIKVGSAGGPTAGRAFPRSVRNEVLSGEPACVFCGEPATQVDHAIARAKGGNATLENAQPSCSHCNPSKGVNEFPKTPPLGYERTLASVMVAEKVR